MSLQEKWFFLILGPRFYESTSPLTFYAEFSVKSSNEFTGKEFFPHFRVRLYVTTPRPPPFPTFFVSAWVWALREKLSTMVRGEKQFRRKRKIHIADFPHILHKHALCFNFFSFVEKKSYKKRKRKEKCSTQLWATRRKILLTNAS